MSNILRGIKITEGIIKEFAPSGGNEGGNYFKALASAWYNGTFNTGSLQKGIKSKEDVERLLQRGILCPDGVTRKYNIDYNSDFDGVEIYSDDYYEHGDYDDTIDSRTGEKWGPYEFMEFSDDDLDEIDESLLGFLSPQVQPKKDKLSLSAMRQIEKDRAEKEKANPTVIRSVDLPKNPNYVRTVGVDEERLSEFAPPGGDDSGPDEDEILYRLAQKWWLGTEEDMIRAERTLASMGWEIGEDEGSYDNGGVFVVRAGDVNGKSSQSGPHEDLADDDLYEEQSTSGVASNLGRSAFRMGKTLKDNPYNITSEKQKNDSWKKGWTQAKHDKIEADSFRGDKVNENLHQWFKEKWVRFGPDGKIRGDCARGDDSEGKPKCLPQSKAHNLGKKGRASAAARKRREDPNPERKGKAINVNTKKKSNEGIAEDTIDMPFGNISGPDVDIGLQHRNEQRAYSGLKKLGLVDTSEQFLTLQEIAQLMTDSSNFHLFAFDTNPVRAYIKFIKMIGWNKNNPTEYNKQGVAENNDPWGSQGRFVGDTGPAQLTTTVARVQLKPGDKVLYKPTEQRATIEAMSKDGTQARIHIATPMGGKTFNCKTSDLKSIGQSLEEKWSQKYKSSINCSHPKGFSQKAHCAGKKKHNESIDNVMEMTCPDCGMCETHGDHSKDKLDELKCWSGFHRVAGTKAGFPGSCAKNKTNEEGVAEGSYDDDKGITHTRGSLVAKLEALPKGSDDFEWNRIQAIHQLKQGNMLRAKYYMALMKRGEQGVAEDTDKYAELSKKIQDLAQAGKEGEANKLRYELNRLLMLDRDKKRRKERGVAEEKCPECSGPMFSELLINEKKDACYYKVKSRYKVWPSAYASGALVKCRKKGASNWGNKSESVTEDEDKCPPATQDIALNLKNRQKAIDDFGYGPLNPDMPNTKFWLKKVDEWNLDSIEEAQESLCGNCAAFDQRKETLDCIAQGIDGDKSNDAEGVIEAGDLGYCKFLKFKCASRRTCDAWVTGGPLTDKEQDVSEGIETINGGKYNVDPNKYYVWAWDGAAVLYGEYDNIQDAKINLPKIEQRAIERLGPFVKDAFELSTGKDLLQRYGKKDVAESKDQEEKYDSDYQDMVKRVGDKAKQGPMKTVYDEKTRRYKVVPVSQTKEDALSNSLGGYHKYKPRKVPDQVELQARKSSILKGITDVDESFGNNYPGTWEQENEPFIKKGAYRITDMTSESSK